MRTFIALLLLCLPGVAHAIPYNLQSLDSTFGAGTITRDTHTGLDWLDLSLSVNMSTDQIAVALAPSGAFFGFRYATNSEVNGLAETFFMRPWPEIFRIGSGLDYSEALTFVNLLGPTNGAGNDLQGVLDPRQDPDTGSLSMAFKAIYTYGVGGSADGDSQGINFPVGADPVVGSWLVRSVPVPEPATIWYVGGGLALFYLVQRRRRTQLQCLTSLR